MGISAKSAICYQFKALTDLWTGSVNLVEQNGQIKEKIVSDRLATTGLLGSIRWWFEVLVRGLGGSACDSSDDKSRCPDKYGQRCVVCEFFGCTSWARKFRFEVLNKDGEIKIDQIRKDDELQLRFTPLRPIHIEEWTLLDTTLRLIAGYGAIGGKTVFKPTDEVERQKETHHQDFGLIEVFNADPPITDMEVNKLRNYVCDDRWRKPADVDFAWASLKHFWFVDGKALSREKVDESTFNKVLGRKESKACRDCGKVHNPPQKCPKTKKHPKRHSEHLVDSNDEISKWLAGSQRESKKVFSFKNPPRTFGFVKPGLIDFDVMKKRLQDVWGKDGWDFQTGEKIIDQLFVKEEERS